MKIDILTLFPNMFEGFLSESIIARAIENKLVEINVIDFRDYSEDKNHKVDDYQFGGGKGMVLRVEPIYNAINSIKTDDSRVIMLTPQGSKYNQTKAYEYSKCKHIILLCGHYEGFDERVRSFVDEEISIGDFILTGGEIPSMVITDSVVRLIDGVIKEQSHIDESFNDNLLDYPVYTHPLEFMGMKVPEVLLSGHHANINKFRSDEALKKTKDRRPDLLEKS